MTEVRFTPQTLEVRTQSEDGTPTLVGYAAVFNSLSVDLGGFVERILPGSFSDTLTRSDVVALFNHDPNFVLGRQSANTLTLHEDERGLWYSVRLPATKAAEDLMTSIARGDVVGSSFSFRVQDDEWHSQPDGTVLRELRQVDLIDVGPATRPAYDATSAMVALRSLQEANTNGIVSSRRRNRLKLVERYQVMEVG